MPPLKPLPSEQSISCCELLLFTFYSQNRKLTKFFEFLTLILDFFSFGSHLFRSHSLSHLEFLSTLTVLSIILAKLESTGCLIGLNCVPSHFGIEGNEKYGKLIKWGTTHSDQLYYKCTVTAALRH